MRASVACLGRGLTALEARLIVRALHRDHTLSQGAIAARLRCHKSWVCRRSRRSSRLLDTSVQADAVRLGLLGHRERRCSGRGVATWQPDSRSGRSDSARAHRAADEALLVRELLDAAEARYSRSRCSRAGRGSDARLPRPGVRAACGVVETITLDVATIRRTAGRLRVLLDHHAPGRTPRRARRISFGRVSASSQACSRPGSSAPSPARSPRAPRRQVP